MNEKEILTNISERLGIKALKPMQLEIAASQSDLIRLAAPTGSGKTIAFVINLLKHIAPQGKGVQSVIIAPSRELVLQIAAVVKAAASGYKVVAFYGGHKMEDEKKTAKALRPFWPRPVCCAVWPGYFATTLFRPRTRQECA